MRPIANSAERRQQVGPVDRPVIDRHQREGRGQRGIAGDLHRQDRDHRGQHRRRDRQQPRRAAIDPRQRRHAENLERHAPLSASSASSAAPALARAGRSRGNRHRLRQRRRQPVIDDQHDSRAATARHTARPAALPRSTAGDDADRQARRKHAALARGHDPVADLHRVRLAADRSAAAARNCRRPAPRWRASSRRPPGCAS